MQVAGLMKKTQLKKKKEKEEEERRRRRRRRRRKRSGTKKREDMRRKDLSKSLLPVHQSQWVLVKIFEGCADHFQ